MAVTRSGTGSGAGRNKARDRDETRAGSGFVAGDDSGGGLEGQERKNAGEESGNVGTGHPGCVRGSESAQAGSGVWCRWLRGRTGIAGDVVAPDSERDFRTECGARVYEQGARPSGAANRHRLFGVGDDVGSESAGHRKSSASRIFLDFTEQAAKAISLAGDRRKPRSAADQSNVLRGHGTVGQTQDGTAHSPPDGRARL